MCYYTQPSTAQHTVRVPWMRCDGKAAACKAQVLSIALEEAVQLQKAQQQAASRAMRAL